MTSIEEIKHIYGNPNKEYYVRCCDCPLDNVDNCATDCNGYEIAWSAIYDYLNDRPTQSNDSVNHPSHYNRGKIEVADFIYDQQLNFNRGNAIKYICRAGFKNDMVEDLEKAIWYLNHELKMLKGCGE